LPFFADTNICDKWESDQDVNRNWLAAKARLEAQGENYVSCPLVLIELLSRLVKPEPAYFSKDLKSFIFQSNNAHNDFLTFPAKFVLKTVLNIDCPVSHFDASDFAQWARVVLSAPSRHAIDQGEVDLGSSLVSYGLSFDKIKSQHEAGLTFFANQMHLRRALSKQPTREEKWTAFLRTQGIVPCDGDVQAIGDALDAAYHYEVWLTKQHLTYDYKSEKHRGDWVDSQLLYYLADPNMHILTNDGHLQSRCVTSKQANRIIVL
jgi:hypothetical protein